MNHLTVVNAALAAIALAPMPARAQQPASQSTREWTLAAVLAAASENHPLVEAARARVSAAEGSRRSAGAFPNPVATYQVENTAYPGQSAPLPGIDRELSIYVTLPLEPFYQRGPRVSRADADVRAANASLTVAKRKVALDAARAFYQVATGQAVLEEAEEAYGNLERLTGYNRRRVSEGVTAEGDLMRVQVEVARAATTVTLAHVELARARAALAPYLGASNPGALVDSFRVDVPTSRTGRSLRTSLPPMASLARSTRERRPELIAARARAASAAAGVTIQRALTVRQLGATFGNKRIGTENAMIAGLTVPFPIFDQNRGEIQRANGERMAAEQELIWEERRVQADLQAAHEIASRLAAQLEALDGTSGNLPADGLLERAQASLRVTQTAYEEGAASLLQVLDAMRAFRDARLTYVRLLYAQRESLIDLAVVAGEEPTAFLASTATSSGRETHQP